MTMASSAHAPWQRRSVTAACALLALLPWSPASAATIVVGPGRQAEHFADALRGARDGDTIEVMPGEYRGDVAVLVQKKLTIRGVGPRPVFIADGRSAEGKAIWVVRDGDVTIENIEFRGARVASGNGAGIRFESGRLTVVRCAFFDNEMGLLTSNSGQAELLIEDSDFGVAPRHDGALHHLLYVGRIAGFTLSGSRLRQGYIGHLVKSRARRSRITYNLIVDGSQGQASYEIDLPNGGDATIIGNVIGQGAHAENPVLVAYGAEGNAWPRSALVLAHNTLVNERPAGATFLRVWQERLPARTEVAVLDNLTVGPGLWDAGTRGRFEGNTATTPEALHELCTGPACVDPAKKPRHDPERN